MGPADGSDSDGTRRTRASHLCNYFFTKWVSGPHRRESPKCTDPNLATRYQIATGSGDDTVRIWDMRSLRALYTIPAHMSNVSDVRFFRGDDLLTRTDNSTPDVVMNGSDVKDEDEKPDMADTQAKEEWKYRSGLYLASAGYDGFVKLWSADDWQLLRTLPTDGGKVMSVDLSNDAKYLASGTYNRNFQLFAPEEIAGPI